MFSKDEILTEIKRTARENGNQPLGTARFERETGISSYEWGRYWPRFGDAQREAGFVPNQLQGPHAEQLIFEKLIQLTRKLGHFPQYREIEAERQNDLTLPTKSVFQRHGTKQQLTQKLLTYCQGRNDLADIVEFCRDTTQTFREIPIRAGVISTGEVYLVKSGKFYKIGRSNDTVRRGKELRIQLPERMNLIHSIKTDDPSGVEAYWHRRFEDKRMQGEWFDLTSNDVAAFKRWKRIH